MHVKDIFLATVDQPKPAPIVLKNCVALDIKVRTMCGCRVRGPGGELEVISVGHRWRDYDAVRCRKENGDERLYLAKNLIPA